MAKALRTQYLNRFADTLRPSCFASMDGTRHAHAARKAKGSAVWEATKFCFVSGQVQTDDLARSPILDGVLGYFVTQC